MNMRPFLLLLPLCLSLTAFHQVGQDPVTIKAAINTSSLVIEFRRPLSKKEMGKYLALAGVADFLKFTPYSSEYFNRLYQLEAKSEQAKTEVRELLAKDSLIKRIEEPKPAYLSSIGESILPASKMDLTQNDPFLTYQWALQSTDQQVLRPINDLDTSPVLPSKGAIADIGLNPAKDVDTLMKRQVLVAVIDSGVDYNHEDLKASIFQNTAECENGLPPVTATKDVDNNGFAGDCMGWDFTATDAKMANKPLDDLGHGTHISGILAAGKNNGIGISGVSNNIKIVPLKVMANTGGSANSIATFQQMALTDKVSKAILYAVKMKVDVINLSMGWPLLFDSEFLRQSFQAAKEAHITIVAAAGNNNTYSTVLPCSYDGVICVAATGIDNQLTDFSNYGGQVEISAPGEQILSTYPKAINTYDFDFKGYEILSGTSQAAPYISAAAAVLKGIYPGISEDEIKARIFASSQKMTATDGRHIQFGTLKLMAAINLAAQPVIAPLFKGLDRINFNMADGTASFTLPIKNYWQSQNGVTVSVRSLAPQFQLTSNATYVGNFASSATQNIQIGGKVLDPSASSNIRLEVAITVPGHAAQIFQQDIILSRSAANDSLTQKMPITLLTSKENLSQSLRTVSDFYDVTHDPEYYWLDKTTTGATLHLLRLVKGGYQELVKNIDGIQALNAIIRMPISDTEWGYWIQSIGTINPDLKLRFDYMSQDLQISTQNSFSYLVNKDDKTFLSQILSPSFMLSNASLVPMQTADTKVIQTMVFVSTGSIPKDDINPNPFEFEDATVQASRIYFFQPTKATTGESTMAIRNYDNYQFTLSLRDKLALKFQDDLKLVKLLPQPYGQTKLRALYAYGTSDNKSLVIVSADGAQLLAHTFDLDKLSTPSTMMATGNMASVIDLSGSESLRNAGAIFAEKITDTTGLVQYLTGNAQTPILSNFVKAQSGQDVIVDFRQAFRDQQYLYSFIETKDNMLLQVNNLQDNSMKSYEVSIHRTSVSEALPVIFSETFNPTTYRIHGKLYPAMFVDASQLFSSHFYITYGDPVNGLISPAEMDFAIPANCTMMNPAKFGASGSQAFVLLCKNQNNNWEMDFLPMQKE